MKLDKAIEILKLHRELNLVDKNPDLRDAIKLGIEALEFYQALKQTGFPPKSFLLPGETKD